MKPFDVLRKYENWEPARQKSRGTFEDGYKALEQKLEITDPSYESKRYLFNQMLEEANASADKILSGNMTVDDVDDFGRGMIARVGIGYVNDGAFPMYVYRTLQGAKRELDKGFRLLGASGALRDEGYVGRRTAYVFDIVLGDLTKAETIKYSEDYGAGIVDGSPKPVIDHFLKRLREYHVGAAQLELPFPEEGTEVK